MFDGVISDSEEGGSEDGDVNDFGSSEGENGDTSSSGEGDSDASDESEDDDTDDESEAEVGPRRGEGGAAGLDEGERHRPAIDSDGGDSAH